MTWIFDSILRGGRPGVLAKYGAKTKTKDLNLWSNQQTSICAWVHGNSNRQKDKRHIYSDLKDSQEPLKVPLKTDLRANFFQFFAPCEGGEGQGRGCVDPTRPLVVSIQKLTKLGLS